MSDGMCNDPCKHLEFIQAVISRLAQNSFLIKGWSVTLLTGLLILVLQQEKRFIGHVLLVAVPAMVFWWLDAYYLYLERRFRELYESAVKEPSGILSMRTPPYSLCAHLRAARSPGIWPLYLTYGLVGLIAYYLRGG